MSNYRSLLTDYPSRAKELLRLFAPNARARKSEVTLTLTFATPTILIPFERLRSLQHPTHEAEANPEIKKAFDELMGRPFLGSPLWPQVSPATWQYGPLASVDEDPGQWPELLQPSPLSPTVTSETIVRHIRNALAHGNIFTRGYPDIDSIVLLSQKAPRVFEFNFLSVSPKHFSKFLDSWLGLIGSWALPAYVLAETEIAAA